MEGRLLLGLHMLINSYEWYIDSRTFQTNSETFYLIEMTHMSTYIGKPIFFRIYEIISSYWKKVKKQKVFQANHISNDKKYPEWSMISSLPVYFNFVFSKKATKIDKSSPYVINVKSTVKISSIFVAFLGKMNFTTIIYVIHSKTICHTC